ncbi:hypothetical protein FT663_04532 [Candidozyma haemuli var. vulneris]|uniref:Methyltransferase type 12 domain-containing protein n=1 Tax=Candidozyma haemuli TaxID=45357 RepID=A0A2V1APT5_9ASCO|nr:hypothetical protein CXQ85_001569 [[Candida] haemuloni]KAF3986472.1 hypothetical protein FT662_04539 [[Candida] haemuloni var. vulneris]KAF3987273.1 hypothetical protein FT663_04532 [[Candida] haemuloni var. vulneris]PVH19263.1 hypothetical protein CXQ85_001569 [[Candida] haemuloni]
MSHLESIKANKEAFEKFVKEKEDHSFIKVLQYTVAYTLLTFDINSPRKDVSDTEEPVDGELMVKKYEELPHGQFVGNLLRPDSKIIDFACGTGAITEMLAPFIPQAEYVGIDISEDMLGKFDQTAGELKKKLPELKVNSICGDVLADDFDDAALEGSADVVFSSLAFHHLHNYNVVAEKLKTFLKPGGHIVIIDMFSDPAKNHHSLLSKQGHGNHHSHSHGHGHGHEEGQGHGHGHSHGHEEPQLNDEAVKRGVSHHGISNEEMISCLSSGCENVSSTREHHVNLWFDKKMADPDGTRNLPSKDDLVLAPCGLIVGIAQKSA